MSEQLDVDWDENFENVATKSSEDLWVSFPVYYIKKNVDGVCAIEKLLSKYELHVERMRRKNEKINIAKERLKKEFAKKVKKVGEREYRLNPLYRIKVRTVLTYPQISKWLYHGIFVNIKHANLKLGIYLACMTFNVVTELAFASDFVLTV